MGSQYAALSGTSMATPHVSALASLILSTNPNLHNTEVMQLIASTTQDLGIRGRDDLFGAGLINVDAALKKAMLSRISPSTVRGPVESNPPSPPTEMPGNTYMSLFQLILAYLRASFEK
jgi:subtilisin family serine protease